MALWKDLVTAVIAEVFITLSNLPYHIFTDTVCISKFLSLKSKWLGIYSAKSTETRAVKLKL